METFNLIALAVLAAIVALLWRDLRRLRRKIDASDPTPYPQESPSMELRVLKLEQDQRRRDTADMKR